MGRDATIIDIAHRAGVSTATVSRVLNRTGKVREETREKVEAAARELDIGARCQEPFLCQYFCGM